MGTEFINQASLRRVELYKYAREIYTGEGEFSLKRGSYKYGDAFINISWDSGFNCFAYLSLEQLEVLRDQIDLLLQGGYGPPIEGWFGYGTESDEITPEEALVILEAGGTVWLKDYAENPEDYGGPDYPVEDPEDIRVMMEDGYFEGDDPVVILAEPSGA